MIFKLIGFRRGKVRRISVGDRIHGLYSLMGGGIFCDLIYHLPENSEIEVRNNQVRESYSQPNYTFYERFAADDE